MIRLIFLSAFLLFSLASNAATCTKTGTTCVDATPCKIISGVQVCLTDPAINATCWQYTDTYNCLPQAPVNYCAAISSASGCIQTGSVCAPGATTATGCTRWTNTYRCGGTAPPSSTVVLNSSYTTSTGSPLTTTALCAQPADNPTCAVAETVAGVKSYSCISQPSTCAPLVTKGCTLSSSACVSPTGGTAANCLLYEKSYSCPSTTQPSSVLNCGSNQYCTGGNCFNAGHAPDTDLAQAVLALEMSRQAATYKDANQLIFGGQFDSCIQKPLGWCCDPRPKGTNNAAIGGNTLMTTGGQAIIAGSKYMFDMMYGGYQAYQAMSAMATTAAYAGAAATSAAASTFSMTSYGVQVTYSAASGFTVAFDPTSLAIAVAIYVITDLMSCGQQEAKLQNKNYEGLCRRIGGGGCVDSWDPTCARTQQNYCCFNSILAKIINNAGVAQLGKSIDNCGGLTLAEFGRIDFARVDFSEFIAKISAAVTLPPPGPVNTDAGSATAKKLANYLKTGKQ